jgi:carbonic anhydrase
MAKSELSRTPSAKHPVLFVCACVDEIECFGANALVISKEIVICKEIWMRISVLTALFLGVTAMAAAQTTAQWEYQGKNGPLNWGKLDPAYRACSQGHEQSPIDIRNAHLNTALKPIEFHYIAGPVTVENDGRTIVVHVDPGSYILADGGRYELVRFEFIRPSESAMKGKLTEMGVHLIHKSADGKLAVIEVRLAEDRGAPNAIVATLWEHLPTTPRSTAKVTDMLNPGGLLPGDPGYWTYMGSLSTPPCTEGVRWFVFEEPVTISREQLRAFTGMFPVASRPLQEPHGRRIEASE